ncbi:AfsR/SARP family transcriptional regulator [Streptomyces profundus]|uniref:AfsR/SARP family transcriptional regulator n=1 Tax=Streptomyces profundus TaxID=2867410 RepID=UPI001D16D235|nr:BTAD domain-containing putative transcriptional regulator [Streptomyces sp. MA3_2.13]UED88055.1 winged helix-turn-helix domain-containing protein [Streptomyces sp. MA3_2.13]
MSVAPNALTVQLLGPLRVWRGDEELAIGPPKQRALFALLATQPGNVVSREQIVDGLWGPEAPNTALNGVHTYVAGLRRVLDPGRRGRESGRLLLSTAGGYELCLPLESVDAAQFVRRCNQARRMAADRQVEAAFDNLGKALGLWRGEALAGVPGPFAALERGRLREMRFSAVEDWIAGMITAGRYEEAIVVTTEAISQEPLREKLRCLLMLALSHCGRQAHALQAYNDARAVLREELGIEPGAELRSLHQRILSGAVGQGQQERAPVPRAAVAAPRPEPAAAGSPPTGAVPYPSQLPSRSRVFVGREEELSSVRQMLTEEDPERGRATPIVAIDGPPGVGKSALALELAHESLDRFPDGHLYADLRGTSGHPPTPFEVLARLLQGLGVTAGSVPADLDGRVMLYRSLLHGKRMLVLLDDALDVNQTRILIPQGPACVIVTGRRPQRGLVARYGAHRISLKPLDSETASGLLIRLLDGAATRGSSEAIHRLVELCGYLPLGIRITAASLLMDPYASPERLAALYEDPVTRLDLLTVQGDEGMSVRAALGASYRSLPEKAARLFRLLAAMGLEGFDVPEPGGAQAVDSEVRGALELLADLGLLERTGSGGYQFSKLIRAYAEEMAELEEGLSRPGRRLAVRSTPGRAGGDRAAFFPRVKSVPEGHPSG